MTLFGTGNTAGFLGGAADISSYYYPHEGTWHYDPKIGWYFTPDGSNNKYVPSNIRGFKNPNNGPPTWQDGIGWVFPKGNRLRTPSPPQPSPSPSSPSPSPSSSPTPKPRDVSKMNYLEKLLAAMEIALKEKIPQAFQNIINDPRVLPVLIGFMVVIAGLALINRAAAVKLIAALDSFLIFQLGFDLSSFLIKAYYAQDEPELNSAADSFASFAINLGTLGIGKVLQLVGVLSKLPVVLNAVDNNVPILLELLDAVGNKIEVLLELLEAAGNNAQALLRLLSKVRNPAQLLTLLKKVPNPVQLEGLLTKVGNNVTKLEELISLVDGNVAKLENLLSLSGNDAVLLERMLKLVNNPSTLEKLLSVVNKDQLPKIKGALNVVKPNGKTDIELDFTVAKTLIENNFDVTAFQKPYGLNGELGEVDIEIGKAVFELTTGKVSKLDQVIERINSPIMNPSGKPVILYAPEYKINAVKNINRLEPRAYFVRNDQELINLLNSLP